MSNEAVMEALRSMATQSLKRVAEKSANEELFAGMVKAKKELEEQAGPETGQVEHHYPELSIVQPTLTLERQIQVRNNF